MHSQFLNRVHCEVERVNQNHVLQRQALHLIDEVGHAQGGDGCHGRIDTECHVAGGYLDILFSFLISEVQGAPEFFHLLQVTGVCCIMLCISEAQSEIIDGIYCRCHFDGTKDLIPGDHTVHAHEDMAGQWQPRMPAFSAALDLSMRVDAPNHFVHCLHFVEADVIGSELLVGQVVSVHSVEIVQHEIVHTDTGQVNSDRRSYRTQSNQVDCRFQVARVEVIQTLSQVHSVCLQSF